MMKSCNLTIVIVSWNVWDLLRACLTSIQTDSVPGDAAHVRRFGPRQQATLQVIVVDNASTDATPTLLPSQFPWVRTFLNDTNLGFSGGNNLALQMLGLANAGQRFQSTMLSGGADLPPSSFVYFLNPDTELLPNSLWTLYHAIASDERIGAIGPQLLYGDGRRQSTRRRFPTLLTGFFESTWLGQAWPNNPWVRRYHVADWPDSIRQDVDWLVGAALLVRWAALEQVGGFDDGFFMYSEELDLCRRLKSAGWRIVYDPGAMVIHYEGRSSEQISTRRHVLFNRSKVRYYRKYFGSIWAELLRRYLLLEFRWQIWLESVKALLGHRRQLRRARVEAYREVVASGLYANDIDTRESLERTS